MASWLVILGALVIVAEHAQYAISLTAALKPIDGQQVIYLPHARLHFFMAGIYTLIGMVLLGVIARTLLKEGRRAGWYALLFALLFGGGSDLVMGGLWFQHGSPLYALLGESVQGFGWQFLYTYFVLWIAALVLSYPAVFRKASLNASSSKPL